MERKELDAAWDKLDEDYKKQLARYDRLIAGYDNLYKASIVCLGFLLGIPLLLLIVAAVFILCTKGMP